MTATLDDVTMRKIKPEPTAQEQLAADLVARARERGVSLTGPDGLLKQVTKTVLESALNDEMSEHLGHGKNERAGPGSGNVRNGTQAEDGADRGHRAGADRVPRDRAGTHRVPAGRTLAMRILCPESRTLAVKRLR